MATAEVSAPTEPATEASAPVQESSDPVAVNVTVTRNNSRSGNNGRFNNAGGVMAMNAIVTTSDIVGGRFQFAGRSVLMAVLQGAKSLISELLGEGEVFFAGQMISIEARQTVVTVMTKLTTAIAVYNETISVMSTQAVE